MIYTVITNIPRELNISFKHHGQCTRTYSHEKKKEKKKGGKKKEKEKKKNHKHVKLNEYPSSLMLLALDTIPLIKHFSTS